MPRFATARLDPHPFFFFFSPRLPLVAASHTHLLPFLCPLSPRSAIGRPIGRRVPSAPHRKKLPPGRGFVLAGQNRQTIRDTHAGGQAANLGAEITENPPLISTTATAEKHPQIFLFRCAIYSAGMEMRREATRKIRLLGLPAPISGEQQPFEGQMHAGAAASSFEVASFALCPCWLVFAGKEREGSK